MNIQLNTLRCQYHELLRTIVACGHSVSPRGVGTREVSPMEIELLFPHRDALPTGTGRGVNSRIAALEALQLIGGVSRHDLLERATGGADGTAAVGGTSFRGGGQFAGGYGPRVRTQLAHAVARLQADPSTRGAVIQLFDPLYDLAGPIGDGVGYMCTVSLQFLQRDGALHMHTNMRSNDAWLGLPYDAFQFTQLQCTVANVLGVPVGRYHHRATSMHLYDKHVPLVESLYVPERDSRVTPFGIIDADSVEEAQQIARDLLDGGGPHGWYRTTLAPLFA